jgi:predicted DNA-binding transcriptional regulator YafY
MAANHETLIRQWHMLRNIPRYPAKVTASQLKTRLDNEDFVVSKRTIERDLLDLSLVFPLALDNRSKPYGWSWQKDAATFDLPGLSQHEALTLMMVEQHLKIFLPLSTHDVMGSYFKAAKNKLNSLPRSRKMGSWLNKVRTVSPNQPLIPPVIKPEVHQLVTEALLKEKQMGITYKSRAKDTNRYHVHPLALIQRGPVTYLAVRFNDYDDMRMLAMHRITEVDILEESTQPPKDFNLDDEINSGRFGFGNGETIKFSAIFKRETGEHLLESKLSEKQSVKELSNGDLRISAEIQNTPQLLWWLLGLGSQVTVESPALLKDKIKQTIKDMSKNYL